MSVHAAHRDIQDAYGSAPWIGGDIRDIRDVVGMRVPDVIQAVDLQKRSRPGHPGRSGCHASGNRAADVRNNTRMSLTVTSRTWSRASRMWGQTSRMSPGQRDIRDPYLKLGILIRLLLSVYPVWARAPRRATDSGPPPNSRTHHMPDVPNVPDAYTRSPKPAPGAPMTTLQDALFDTSDTPAQLPNASSALNPSRGHPAAPRRNPEHRAQPCNPTCTACGQTEPSPDATHWPLCPATRSQHATLCEHTNQPYKADVCLITTHAAAELLTSAHSGHTIAAVQCPHCGALHAHAPTPGTHYRTSRCPGRKPYIVHTPERSTL